MNADFDPSSLSAFLDGELSPEETAVLRQQIAESDAAATELAELESLSKLVQGIPVASAPQGLLADVMGSLPEGVTTSPDSTTGPTVSRSWMGVAGGMVAALTLCIVVVVSNNDNEKPERGGNVTMRPAGSAPAPPAMARMDSRALADEAADGVPESVSPARELEPVVDTGFIQQDAELVRVHFNPDELHQRLASAKLSTQESSEAPEGYRAFVVEGSRSRINEVLKQFQTLTEDRSIEIDRHSVPGTIVAEFEMEAQQKQLIALADRGPAMLSESAMPAPEVRFPPSGGAGFAGGNGLSGGGSARLSRSRQADKVASVEKKPGIIVKNSVKGKELLAKAEQPSKVLFYYELPAKADPKSPCEGV